MWNTEGNNNNQQEQKTYLTCNTNKHDITGLSGQGLVQKLKEIARAESIAKFDIFDSNGRSLSPEEIEAGAFSGDLSLVRFNAAA